MNVLILATHLNPGGISRYVVNLAKGLMSEGHNVLVATGGGEWAGKISGCGARHKIIPIKTKSICSLKIIKSLFSLLPIIRKERIQVVHANTRVTQYLSFLISKLTKVPYVSSFHGFYNANFGRKMFRFEGHRSIAVSLAVKKHLTDGLGINDKTIAVVHNGIDIEEFSTRKKTKHESGFKNEDFCVGILGRISEEKGHLLAVSALKELTACYPETYLLISGRGKLEEELKSFIKETGTVEKVKFLDCPAEDFLDVLDLLIVPSKKEGFGYSIIEAFAKKIPVIGFNTGGISEIIKNGENGLLFYEYNAESLADTVKKLMSDNGLKTKIVEQARNDVLEYSIENMAAKTAQVYAGLAAGMPRVKADKA